MNLTFSTLKPLMLGLAILVGLCAQTSRTEAAELKKAVVAGGCFWCVEKDFESVNGVIEAVSGFAGGDVANPTYKQVSKGRTGHIEAVEITYDPAIVSYDQLLHMFLRSIDVTDAGGQFCDRGHTYTTAIFVSDSAENASAQAALDKAASDLGRDIVTPIRSLNKFFPAKEYHQDYYKKKDIVVTRFGPLTKAKAYKRYRKGCGRDAGVVRIWGGAAAFAKGS